MEEQKNKSRNPKQDTGPPCRVSKPEICKCGTGNISFGFTPASTDSIFAPSQPVPIQTAHTSYLGYQIHYFRKILSIDWLVSR